MGRTDLRRLGPRPLPLHLASAATIWASSRAALAQLRSGLLPWKPELAAAASALRQSVADLPPDDFAVAVDAELRSRADIFLRGLERYRRHPYRRTLVDRPVLWRDGSLRLVDYGPTDGAPVLVVPSLVNRAYILDLAEGKSLLRYLADIGLRPLLVDWGRPDTTERRFNLTDYIAGRLEAAAEAAVTAAGTPVAVVGYCMGGLLAVALECLGGWYGDNTPGRGRWQVASQPVIPARVAVPSLVVVPGQDRIVPPATAAALADGLRGSERLTPPLGHIGMMVAREAPAAVWQPLGRWLLAHGTPRAPRRRKKRRD